VLGSNPSRFDDLGGVFVELDAFAARSLPQALERFVGFAA
jgi:hypothetical protein